MNVLDTVPVVLKHVISDIYFKPIVYAEVGANVMIAGYYNYSDLFKYLIISVWSLLR